MFAIYQITNKVNGKFYVGFTSKEHPGDRWTEHLVIANSNRGFHFHRAIRKYGASNFKFEVLEEGWDPRIGLEIREPFWIQVLKPEYNMTKGGEGVLGMADEARQRKSESLSKAMKGNQNGLGYRFTDSQTHVRSSQQMGNKNASGVQHSVEHNLAKSTRQKGSRRSEEFKKAQSIRMKGWNLRREQPQVSK